MQSRRKPQMQSKYRMKVEEPVFDPRDQTIKRTCEPVPGLYAYMNLGVRHKIVHDPDFPVRSLYAFQVLNGDKLNDDATGSFRMTQLKVIEIAKRYGLRLVHYYGDNYWQDDVPEGKHDNKAVRFAS